MISLASLRAHRPTMRRRLAAVCLLPLALTACNSATVDLVSNVTPDPFDILGRTLALPYAVVADAFTLGNGKNLASHDTSESTTTPAPQPVADSTPQIDWKNVPDVDWNDIFAHMTTGTRAEIPQRRLERSVGELFGARHATCEDGNCTVATRISCEKIDSRGKMADYAADFFKDTIPGATDQPGDLDEVHRVWRVSIGPRQVVGVFAFCDYDNNEALAFRVGFFSPITLVPG